MFLSEKKQIMLQPQQNMVQGQILQPGQMYPPGTVIASPIHNHPQRSIKPLPQSINKSFLKKCSIILSIFAVICMVLQVRKMEYVLLKKLVNFYVDIVPNIFKNPCEKLKF